MSEQFPWEIDVNESLGSLRESYSELIDNSKIFRRNLDEIIEDMGVIFNHSDDCIERGVVTYDHENDLGKYFRKKYNHVKIRNVILKLKLYDEKNDETKTDFMLDLFKDYMGSEKSFLKLSKLFNETVLDLIIPLSEFLIPYSQSDVSSDLIDLVYYDVVSPLKHFVSHSGRNKVFDSKVLLNGLSLDCCTELFMKHKDYSLNQLQSIFRSFNPLSYCLGKEDALEQFKVLAVLYNRCETKEQIDLLSKTIWDKKYTKGQKIGVMVDYYQILTEHKDSLDYNSLLIMFNEVKSIDQFKYGINELKKTNQPNYDNNIYPTYLSLLHSKIEDHELRNDLSMKEIKCLMESYELIYRIVESYPNWNTTRWAHLYDLNDLKVEYQSAMNEVIGIGNNLGEKKSLLVNWSKEVTRVMKRESWIFEKNFGALKIFTPEVMVG